MKKIIKLIIVLFVLSVITQPRITSAIEIPSEYAFEPPIVGTKQITNETTQIKVKCEAGTKLVIKAGKKKIAKVYYEHTEFKKVTIKRQKVGTILKFYATCKNKVQNGENIYKKIEKAPYKETAKVSKKIKSPIIKEKKIKNDMSTINVKCKKGQTLYILCDKKLYKKIKYKKTGYKTITLPERVDGYKLTLYTKRKATKKSESIVKKVKDVIAPKMPKVTVIDNGWSLRIKGEVDTRVMYESVGIEEDVFSPYDIKYERSIGKVGLKNRLVYSPDVRGLGARYCIRLKDKAGNLSDAVVYTLYEDESYTIEKYAR